MSYLSAPSIILILRWSIFYPHSFAPGIEAQQVFITYDNTPYQPTTLSVPDTAHLHACKDAQSRYVFLKGPTKVGGEITRVRATIDGQLAQTYRIRKEGSETPFFIDENSGRVSVKRPDKLGENSTPYNLTVIASVNGKSCFIQVYILSTWQKEPKERTFYIPLPPAVPHPQPRTSANQDTGNVFNPFADNFSVIPPPAPPNISNNPFQPFNPFLSTEGQGSKLLIQPPTYEVTYITFAPFVPIPSNPVTPTPAPKALVVDLPITIITPPPQLTTINPVTVGVIGETHPRQGSPPRSSFQPTTQPDPVPLNVVLEPLHQGTLPKATPQQLTQSNPVTVVVLADVPTRQGASEQQAPPSTFSNSQSAIPIAFHPPGLAGGYGGPAQQNGGTPSGMVCSTCRPPPVCSQPLYTAIVPESTTVGTSVMRAVASGQGVQWSISDTAFERFTINPVTGEVTVAGSLRRRTRAAMEFKIRATDMFGLWCDSILRVNVVPDNPIDDVSRNPGNSQPYFVQNYYYFAIQCGAGAQRVGSVLATDLDTTQTLTYQLINTNEFAIDSNGNIQTTGTIQTSSDRTFFVVVMDNGSPRQTATTTVTITVSGSCGATQSSNTPPTFGQSTYTLTASCRVNNVFAGMITTTDYERNSVAYSVQGTQEFTINPTTGELRSQGTLTDSRPRTFSVIATDSGSPPMSSMVTVTVNIVNCSPMNNPPAFGQSAYQFTIPCLSGSPAVGATQAYDTDGNSIVYSVTGTQEFSVNPTTGTISLTFPLQTAGVRQFSVVATDNGQPPLSVTAAVTVVITGSCQQTQPTYPLTYPTYPTPPVTYPTYPTQPPPTQQPFTFPPQTQFTAPPPQTFTQQTYLPFTTPQPTFTYPPQINTFPTTPYPVQTVGTTFPAPAPPPIFSQASYFYVVPCSSGNLLQIGTVQAVDPRGTAVTYNVVSGSPGFDIDYMTGALVSLAPVLQVGSRSVVVVATNSGSPRTSATNTVQIIIVGPCTTSTTPSQTYPTFPPAYSTPPVTFPPYQPTQQVTFPSFPIQTPPPPQQQIRFSQSSYTLYMTCPLNTNQLVGVVQATSPQAQVVTYSLSGTPDFIVSNAGEVRTTHLLTGPVTSSFQVTAMDNLGGVVTVQVQVSVPGCQLAPTPQPPTFPQTYYAFSVPCPSSSNILIGTVTAQASQPQLQPQQQQQQQQGLTYNLASTNQFSVDNFGEIRSSILLASGQSYSFGLIVADARYPQLSASVQITVNVGVCASQPAPTPPVTFPPFQQTQAPNQPPYFTVPSYSFTAVCNSQPGTTIGSVYAFDDRSTVVYSLQSQNFAINTATGDIRTTTQILSNNPITLNVVATDLQGLQASATVAISVTGCGASSNPVQPPQINGPLSSTFTNCDQSTGLVASGTQVGAVSATSMQPGGIGRLTYTITGDGRFSVSPNSGQIFTTTSLDSGSFLFVVQVADLTSGQAASATATFSLVVDCASLGYRPCNPPTVDSSISESAPVGSLVTSITSSGIGSYTSGVSSSRPYSGPGYGSTGSSLNYVGSPAYTNNDKPPFPAMEGAYRRRSLVFGGLNPQQQQPDASNGGPSSGTGFQIQKASAAGVFRIDPNSGQISLAQPLDRERVDSYVMKIRSLTGNQYCVTKVGIEVMDVNDNAPVFLNQSYAFTAPCGPPNAFVGVVTAHDADSGLRGFVNYSILNANNPQFGIDCFTGEIRLRRSVTSASLPTTLMIQADNPSTPTQSTTIAVAINPGAGC